MTLSKACIYAILLLIAIIPNLHAHDPTETSSNVYVGLIAKERINQNDVILPNGERRILYAQRSDYDSLLGPRRGEGFLKGWCSENGKYIGFADYIGTNTNFSLLDANKHILWQKRIKLQVVHVNISNSGRITILFIGYFATHHIERVEVRDSTGQLITRIKGGAAGGLVAFSDNEAFGLFVSHDFRMFNNKAEVTWELPNIIRQNLVISDDGNHAAIFSPLEQPSPANGITFLQNGKITKHHPLPLSPFGGPKGYVSQSDDYLLLCDRDTAYLFDFRTGDSLWQKPIGNCRFARWIDSQCLLVIDSSGSRKLKCIDLTGRIVFQQELSTITQEDIRKHKYWTRFLEKDNISNSYYLIIPPYLYLLDIHTTPHNK